MTSAATALAKIAMTEYAAGDYIGAIALSDPLIRWDDRALDPDGQLVWGRDDVLDYLAQWMDNWEAYTAEVNEIKEVGDRIVVTYTERGIDRATGLDLQQERAAAIKVEKAAITGWSRFLTESEAVGAAQAGAGGRF